ncbi:MAG: two-component regulator propeller domain-containing protein [Bacteroidales bacterium]
MKSFFTAVSVVFSVGLLIPGCGDDSAPHLPLREVKNPVNSIAFDEQGNTWIGNENGLFRVHSKTLLKMETGFPDAAIYCLAYEDRMLVAASSQGVLSFDIDAADQLILHETLDSSNSLLPVNKVYSYATDHLHRRWFGTGKGIVMQEGSTWKKNKEISLNLVVVSGVPVTNLAFRPNDLHMATSGKNVVHVLFNRETDAVSGASQLLGGQDNPGYNYNGDLTTDTIFCVYASRDSSIWFGSEKGLTRNKGANNVALSTAFFEYFLQGERVHAILEDSYGNIWAGTEDGLFVQENESWHQYTHADGLPDGYIIALAEQTNGHIWVQTKKGVAVIEGSLITSIGEFVQDL